MAPGDTHVSVCTRTTFGWCLELPKVPRLHLWESGAGGALENTRREGERKRGRVGCRCTEGGVGGGGGGAEPC